MDTPTLSSWPNAQISLSRLLELGTELTGNVTSRFDSANDKCVVQDQLDCRGVWFYMDRDELAVILFSNIIGFCWLCNLPIVTPLFTVDGSLSCSQHWQEKCDDYTPDGDPRDAGTFTEALRNDNPQVP